MQLRWEDPNRHRQFVCTDLLSGVQVDLSTVVFIDDITKLVIVYGSDDAFDTLSSVSSKLSEALGRRKYRQNIKRMVLPHFIGEGSVANHRGLASMISQQGGREGICTPDVRLLGGRLQTSL